MSVIEPVQHELRVESGPEEAFAVFVERLGEWWPAEYTWSGGKLEQIGIEARVGGFCFELGPHGFRCDWGRVTEFEPPARLAFTWQIGPSREPVPDPDRASEVEVTFEPDDEGTLVNVAHRGFDRHGEGAEAYRDGLASEQGWPYVLKGYRALTTPGTE